MLAMTEPPDCSNETVAVLEKAIRGESYYWKSPPHKRCPRCPPPCHEDNKTARRFLFHPCSQKWGLTRPALSPLQQVSLCGSSGCLCLPRRDRLRCPPPLRWAD